MGLDARRRFVWSVADCAMDPRGLRHHEESVNAKRGSQLVRGKKAGKVAVPRMRGIKAD